jgi:hypothetical protein
MTTDSERQGGERCLYLIALSLLVTILAWHKVAYAADEFASVRCGADIAKALIGKHASTSRVVLIEARHKDLGLKDLGGYEASPRLFLSSWLICGEEYMEIVADGSRITDVIAIPHHSRTSPEFIGLCTVAKRDRPKVIVAILGTEEAEGSLPAKDAWEVDDAHHAFVKVDTTDLRCPRNGIVTEDGGM